MCKFPLDIVGGGYRQLQVVNWMFQTYVFPWNVFFTGIDLGCKKRTTCAWCELFVHTCVAIIPSPRFSSHATSALRGHLREAVPTLRWTSRSILIAAESESTGTRFRGFGGEMLPSSVCEVLSWAATHIAPQLQCLPTTALHIKAHCPQTDCTTYTVASLTTSRAPCFRNELYPTAHVSTPNQR